MAAYTKKEWNANTCDKCGHPLRDDLCDEMATVDEVLNATDDLAPEGWTVNHEYPDSVGVTHPTLTDDQFIMFGDVNGYFAFNDVNAADVCGSMENLTDAKEIAANFWQQIAEIYPNLVKGE
jgi:hypothetical protein